MFSRRDEFVSQNLLFLKKLGFLVISKDSKDIFCNKNIYSIQSSTASKKIGQIDVK